MFDIEAFLQSAWFAALAGTVGQMMGTQKVKFLLPEDLTDRQRKVRIWLLSLALAWLPTFFIYWGNNGWTADAAHTGFWLGFVVWVAGTVLYEIFVAIAVKWNPALEGKLSARVEAEERRRTKTIQTLRGFKQVDEDYKTDHEAGERTVIPAGTKPDETVFAGESTVPREDAGKP